jgi:hypothetical protein
MLATALAALIPKLIVRVRFSSPAPRASLQVSAGMLSFLHGSDSEVDGVLSVSLSRLSPDFGLGLVDFGFLAGGFGMKIGDV